MGLAPQPEVFSFYRGAVKCRERVPPPVVSEYKSVFEMHAWARGAVSSAGRDQAAACNLTLLVLSRD